jgi:uncharacterized protein (TIGR03435 family)
MIDLQHRLYATIVRLHPPAFRREFGREMQLDFEEALSDSGSRNSGSGFLYLDGLQSLGRQWTKTVFALTPEPQPLPKPSLLSGNYLSISLGAPTPIQLALSTLLSAAFYIALGMTLSAQPHPILSAPPAGLANSPGHIGPSAHSFFQEQASSNLPSDASPTTSTFDDDDAVGEPGYIPRTKSGFLGSHRHRGIGKRAVPTGPSFAFQLWPSLCLAAIFWMLSRLWLRKPSLARRIVITFLGALAIVAPAASEFFLRDPPQEAIRATPPMPAFEVISIRPWKPLVTPVLSPPPPPPDGTRSAPTPRERVVPIPGPLTSDSLRMILPTRMLIAFAYQLPLGSENHVLGGPDWLDSEQYELHAKIEDSLFATLKSQPTAVQRERVALMGRSLLTDRFHLQAHTEMREGAVFALTAIKGGPKLTPSKEGETPRLSVIDVAGGLRMTATAIPLDVWLHSPFLGGRPITDQTGLTGTYDFQLTWRPTQLNGSDLGDETPVHPPLLQAIEEQLGLRLTPTKGPVKMIVIDHIDRPSPN